MCGITGIFGFQNQIIDQKLLAAMNRQMIHRGPDSEGFYTHRHVGLAMRRLKVIDLSTGNQPIPNQDKTLWIVFNGEIYNYREIREKLIQKGHRFSTSSDTEVIVHLYQEEGEKCLNSLIGMFAFAIYDTKQDSLFIARDRLGIKPLFYHHSSEGVVFGSEIKPVLESKWVSSDLDYQAVSHFFSYNYLPQPFTPWKGVRQLDPGHWMKIIPVSSLKAFVGDPNDKYRVEIQPYWDLASLEPLEVSEEEAAKNIMRLLHQSMERRLIADVPIGAFLSGGLDSSTLVYLMKEHRHEKIKTFSVGFDDPAYDETPYAREVAEYFGTDHYEIRCKPEDVSQYFKSIVWHADNLLGDQATLPLYQVSKLAREHVTVCLSGDGGDEIFVGYPTFQADQYHQLYKKIPSFLRNGIIEPLAAALPASADKLSFEYKTKKFIQAGAFDSQKAHYWWRTIFTDDEKKAMFRPEALSRISSIDSFSVYESYFKKISRRDFVNQCLYADMKVWLVGNNLYKVDTMSMAHGLEARVPFLDHELVEYMTRLSPSLKFKNNTLKYLFKKIITGKLPPRIVQRKKAGFHAPISGWLRHDLTDFVDSMLFQHNPVFDVLIQRSYVENVLAEHRSGKRNNAFKIWGLLVLSSWMKQFYGLHANR